MYENEIPFRQLNHMSRRKEFHNYFAIKIQG